ncbi:MAG: T9SS type A sorting domain-containing protein [Saprospiraceae bacterium]
MKKLLLAASLTAAFWGNISAQITLNAWNLNGQPGDQVSNAATTTDGGLNAGGLLIRGAGITAVAGVNTMNARAWTSNTSPAPTDYYEFSISMHSNIMVNVTNIAIVLDRDGSGPQTVQLRSSLDNFVGSLGVQTAPLTVSTKNFPLALTGLTGVVTFRLYGYRASNNTGTLRVGHINGNDVTITGTVALPLRWVSFAAQAKNTEVQLSWRTAQEENVDYFGIERSLNGRDFTEIGRMPAYNRSENSYDYMDNTWIGTKSGDSYYRIKEHDLDGTVYISTLAIVKGKTDGTTELIYPNPASDHIFISGNLESESYQVFSSNGKLVSEGKLEGNGKEASLDVRNLPVGAYFIRIGDDGKAQRFVKK